MSAADGFAATAATYDRARRQLIPCFDRFYGTAVEVLGTATRPIRRVLDLGAGTGLFAAMVAAAHPEVNLVLVDEVSEMLDQSRARLVGIETEYVLGSFDHDIPSGPFDAVVSALAVHHLPDRAKQDLMYRIAGVLASGGIFVNAEQVAAATPTLDVHQIAGWRHTVTVAGVSAEDLAAADRRMAADICAPVEAQLQWLRNAGFTDVDAPFRDGRFAVIRGRR